MCSSCGRYVINGNKRRAEPTSRSPSCFCSRLRVDLRLPPKRTEAKWVKHKWKKRGEKKERKRKEVRGRANLQEMNPNLGEKD